MFSNLLRYVIYLPLFLAALGGQAKGQESSPTEGSAAAKPSAVYSDSSAKLDQLRLVGNVQVNNAEKPLSKSLGSSPASGIIWGYNYVLRSVSNDPSYDVTKPSSQAAFTSTIYEQYKHTYGPMLATMSINIKKIFSSSAFTAIKIGLIIAIFYLCFRLLFQRPPMSVSELAWSIGKTILACTIQLFPQVLYIIVFVIPMAAIILLMSAISPSEQGAGQTLARVKAQEVVSAVFGEINGYNIEANKLPNTGGINTCAIAKQLNSAIEACGLADVVKRVDIPKIKVGKVERDPNTDDTAVIQNIQKDFRRASQDWLANIDRWQGDPWLSIRNNASLLSAKFIHDYNNAPDADTGAEVARKFSRDLYDTLSIEIAAALVYKSYNPNFVLNIYKSPEIALNNESIEAAFGKNSSSSNQVVMGCAKIMESNASLKSATSSNFTVNKIVREGKRLTKNFRDSLSGDINAVGVLDQVVNILVKTIVPCLAVLWLCLVEVYIIAILLLIPFWINSTSEQKVNALFQNLFAISLFFPIYVACLYFFDKILCGLGTISAPTTAAGAVFSVLFSPIRVIYVSVCYIASPITGLIIAFLITKTLMAKGGSVLGGFLKKGVSTAFSAAAMAIPQLRVASIGASALMGGVAKNAETQATSATGLRKRALATKARVMNLGSHSMDYLQQGLGSAFGIDDRFINKHQTNQERNAGKVAATTSATGNAVRNLFVGASFDQTRATLHARGVEYHGEVMEKERRVQAELANSAIQQQAEATMKLAENVRDIMETNKPSRTDEQKGQTPTIKSAKVSIDTGMATAHAAKESGAKKATTPSQAAQAMAIAGVAARTNVSPSAAVDAKQQENNAVPI